MYGENIERGDIKDVNRYKQLISYAGLERRRKITPTDIDGLIDYNGNSFIYMEGKMTGKAIDYGQKKALQNLIDSHEKAGNPSIAIIFRHDEPPDQKIIAKDKLISEIYYKGEWRPPSKVGITVLEFIEKWEEYWDNKNYSL
jgi:hypothetical protein